MFIIFDVYICFFCQLIYRKIQDLCCIILLWYEDIRVIIYEVCLDNIVFIFGLILGFNFIFQGLLEFKVVCNEKNIYNLIIGFVLRIICNGIVMVLLGIR